MTSFMTHFPILAIMALFFGAFLVALVGRKSEILRNGLPSWSPAAQWSSCWL